MQEWAIHRAALKLLMLLFVVLLPIAATAQVQGNEAARPATGLVWNRTGLPAVFPLQVKTRAGQDYFMVLSHADTGKAALAAMIEGGRFFKVLVPPGTFTVSFAIGNGWQGEEALFGPGDMTQFLELPEPLTFGVRGFSAKAGHLVDLTKTGPGRMAQVTLSPQRICQSHGIVSLPRRRSYLAPLRGDARDGMGLGGHDRLFTPHARMPMVGFHGGSRSAFARISGYDPALDVPVYGVRKRVC